MYKVGGARKLGNMIASADPRQRATYDENLTRFSHTGE
jgi:hypothetical protein